MKDFVGALDPKEYKRRLRAQEAESGAAGPPDPGNPTVNFRGEKRSNATHYLPHRRRRYTRSFGGLTMNRGFAGWADYRLRDRQITKRSFEESCVTAAPLRTGYCSRRTSTPARG
jgi:hypothetical protein